MASTATVFMACAAASALRDLDHLSPAILSTVRAGAVALRRLAARGTCHVLRHDEGIVCPTLVALLMRGPSLRYGHRLSGRWQANPRVTWAAASLRSRGSCTRPGCDFHHSEGRAPGSLHCTAAVSAAQGSWPREARARDRPRRPNRS